MIIDINFNQLIRPSSPNYYLACPPNRCNIKPNKISNTYSIPVDTLKKKWQLAIQSEPRFKLVHDDDADQKTYVQRSFLFRFPDYITVKFYALGADKSTLAILSRSKYGYSDFGVNKSRVNRLLKRL